MGNVISFSIQYIWVLERKRTFSFLFNSTVVAENGKLFEEYQSNQNDERISDFYVARDYTVQDKLNWIT